MTARRVATPARQALRTYWGTAVLLAAACAAALAVLLPAASLVARGAGVPSRLAVPHAGGTELELAWGALVRSPDSIRAAAVASLSHLLLGVAAGVVAVSWLTTLSLSTARAATRAPEVVIRRAVGATRLNLLLSALLEGGVIAVAALVVGGATGLAAARIALGAWPGTVGPAAAAPAAVTVGFTLAGIVLGALLPLAYARRGARLVTAEEAPLALVVPVVQLGVSLAVLVAGSMLGRGAAAAGAAPAGSGSVFEITTRASSPAARAAAYAAMLRDLGGDPSVEVASLTSAGETAGLGPVAVVVTDCGACQWGNLPFPFHTLFAAHHLVSADSFRALGLRVVAGRAITGADGWGDRRVAVVSRSLADLHFEAAGAVGRSIRVGHGAEGLYTVVGVVDDRPPLGLGGYGEPPDAVYLSVLQHPAPAVELLVRGATPGGADAAVDRALRRVPGTRLGVVSRISEARVLEAEAAPLRWFGAMFGGEGWAMLLIATIGTFAVMWLWVTSLLRELGVRRAVGARRRHILVFVLSRAGAVALAGIAFGSWVGMMLWDALSAAVARLPAWDPHALARYGLLLAAATPRRRAPARVARDPRGAGATARSPVAAEGSSRAHRSSGTFVPIPNHLRRSAR